MKALQIAFLLTIFLNLRAQVITIESELLNNIDGKQFILKKMNSFITLEDKITKILSGKVSDTCTFEMLIELEDSLPPKKRDLILQKFIKQFSGVMQKYLSDLQIVRDPINHLIEKWAQDCQQPTTPLLLITKDHANKTLEDTLLEHIKSLKTFKYFLKDLQDFLESLKISLPKTFLLYQDAVRKSEERHHGNPTESNS